MNTLFKKKLSHFKMQQGRNDDAYGINLSNKLLIISDCLAIIFCRNFGTTLLIIINNGNELGKSLWSLGSC